MPKQLLTIQKKPREWMITWSENKLRWVLLYYLVGLIVSFMLTFFEEIYFPQDLRYLHKSIFVTVIIPFATVLVSILGATRSRSSQPEAP